MDRQVSKSKSSSGDSASFLPWILVTLIIVFMLVVRVRLREMPLERDEGEYAYAGQLMLQGIPPYKLAYNMKLPGTYAAYALIMAVFGQSTAGIHLGLAVVNAACIVLVFLVGRRLLDEVAGVAAAAAYAFMSLSPSVLGLQAHATHFVVLLALAGLFVFLRASATGRWRGLCLSGILFGLAFVMKQHGILFGMFGFGYLLWVRARVQREGLEWSRIRARSVPFDWGKYGKELGAFGIGLALPYVIVCLLLGAAGVFSQFAFWTISYANKYITAVPLKNGPELLRDALNVVTGPNLLFWLLAAFGAIVMWGEKRLRKNRFLLAGLLVASLLSISIGLYFRPHYFILLLPVLSLLAGVAVSRGVYLMKQSATMERFIAVPAIGLLAAGLCFSLFANGEVWFTLSPTDACRQIYGNTLFSQAEGVGDSIRTSSDSHATIAVLGSEPEIYFYAHRHSATGYIYMYPLMESHAYAQKMQDDMIREIEAVQPEFVVFVTVRESWLPQRGSKSKIQDWWANYWTSRYDLAQSLNIEARTPSTGEERKLDEPGDVMIFKRKTTPTN